MVNKPTAAFRNLRPIHALVIGDFLLDTYTFGRIRRISPEAPVPVLEVEGTEMQPGGAGNVVLNFLALGATVTIVGRVGADEEGVRLKEILAKAGAESSGLLSEEGYHTPVKNRMMAGQQLLRVDREKIVSISHAFEEILVEEAIRRMDGVQVVAISDYGKGLLTRNFLRKVIEAARSRNLFVVVDPKGPDFTRYERASLIKPNLSEAYAAAKLLSQESLEEVASRLLSDSKADRILVTRSEAGMSLFDATGERRDFPVRSKEVKDVTGAGDTVLAMLSVAWASGLDIVDAVSLANIAAGISIERLGCAQVTLSDLAHRLLEMDSESKVFDGSHTEALRQVLAEKRCTLLVLEPNQPITRPLLREIRTLGSRDQTALILYIEGATPEDEWVHLLAGLPEVHSIIVHTDRLKDFAETVRPSEIFFWRGDALYSGSPTALLHQLLQNVSI